MNFNPNNISLITLVGFFENAQAQHHIQIPIEVGVQNQLAVMMRATTHKIGLPANLAQLPVYSPADKYCSEEPLQLPLNTSYINDLLEVINLQNLPSDVNALNFVEDLEYYYAIFTDDQGRRLFGFRRASQFKGISKSKLAILNGGLLTLVTQNVFKLDNDFDYLVDDANIFILRPSGFEYTTNVHAQILVSAAANATAIQADMDFLDITKITTYASSHHRSARLLAAIKSRNDLNLIDRNLLVTACADLGIVILQNPDGTLGPDDGNQYDFLCMIDRRLYLANLIPNHPEKYEASSRVQK